MRLKVKPNAGKNRDICSISAILESSNAMGDDSVNKKYELSAEITENCRIQVPPVCAIIGGVLGQEAIKAIGLKEAPLDNWFLFNGDQMAGNVIRIWESERHTHVVQLLCPIFE